ncbi:hypothetical protein [Halobacterium hubeiense]|nr:hypothetical protein [Halobacterium hubeiense]
MHHDMGESDEEDGTRPDSSTNLDGESLELLKEKYMVLREETHLRIELQQKRLTGGVTVIGAIIGYGLLSGNHAVIAVTPFILGLLYIESARTYRQIGALARHLYAIEEDLKTVNSKFNWEHEYGGFFGVGNGLIDRSLYRVPTYALITVAAAAYIALAIISLRFWPPEFGTWPGRITLITGIALWTAVILVAWYSAHKYIGQLPETTSE